MFVYSVKASSLKLIGIISAMAAAMAVLFLLVPAGEAEAAETSGSVKISYEKIKTADDRAGFLNQFGWEIDPEPVEEVKLTIPSEFDNIMNSYNELQKHQGLDLSKFRGKEVERYTYKVSNYPGYSGTVYANVIIYKNRVIGGDICSSDVSGFIHDFTFPTDNA
jgi:hypothetical protein